MLRAPVSCAARFLRLLGLGKAAGPVMAASPRVLLEVPDESSNDTPALTGDGNHIWSRV